MQTTWLVTVGCFAGTEYSVAVESATLGSSRKTSGDESWIPMQVVCYDVGSRWPVPLQRFWETGRL